MQTITIEGTLKFITQFKQLKLDIDDDTFDALAKFENRGKRDLVWEKDDIKKTRVNLIKYMHTDQELMRLELYEDKKIKVKVQLKHYDSDKYGVGTNLLARKVWLA